MRRILVALIVGCCSVWAMGGSISNIERSGNWYYIYDELAKKVKTLRASSVGDVKGWCSDFFVAQNGSWIYLFDINGKKLKPLSSSTTGEVIAVSGKTFTTKSGNWIYTFDINGKKINTRHQ